MHFTELVDLAAERLGGVVLFANDDFFAPKENLLKASKPVFIEDRYTGSGKWMDGWETRRRRTPGCDWCVIRLGLPGTIRGVVVDTSHFEGNYPEQCSLEACEAEPAAAVELLESPATPWAEILPPSPLRGDCQNSFEVHNARRFTHLRFKIYPDGGIARLRVYGEVAPDWERLAPAGDVDLAAVENGGLVIAASDMFFGSRQNLIMPGPAANMGDGWETRRRRGPGYDWVVVRLGARGTIHRVEVDTSHFKGNFPDSCSLEGAAAGEGDWEQASWKELLPQTKLQADAVHRFEKEVREIGAVTHVRLNIYPDGGVARLRLFGTAHERQKSAWTPGDALDRLNWLPAQDVERELLACCGSAQWARRMEEKRPFRNLEQIEETADRLWWKLQPEDWLEAFRCHPRIGEKAAPAGQAQRWSGQEQASARGAAPETLAALAEANRAYEAKFGYLFIVCATGKTAEEMLALLHKRLENDPEKELRVAAEEQRRITRLRLKKLLQS